MPYPISADDSGIKIKPEYMEKERMYYCLYSNKVILVFKDEQEFLNCYEIEEAEVVKRVKECEGPDDIEKVIEDFVSKNEMSNIK